MEWSRAEETERKSKRRRGEEPDWWEWRRGRRGQTGRRDGGDGGDGRDRRWYETKDGSGTFRRLRLNDGSNWWDRVCQRTDTGKKNIKIYSIEHYSDSPSAQPQRRQSRATQRPIKHVACRCPTVTSVHSGGQLLHELTSVFKSNKRLRHRGIVRQ